MTNKEAINVLRQVNKILVSDKSWLENTHEPLNTAFDMAIEALEKEPCDDAISRQAMLSIIECHKNIDGNDAIVWIEKEIGELPSVTPQPRWIPCSERLPDKDGCYLVSTTGTNNDIIDIAYYTEEIWHKASRIKAWMPLPEPYKAESEG